ncbi:metallophosphoesterase [Reichenbachiella sp.]|uniref:metallophosphoesterase n=1 Tax=Reichenbachiella sp. TaxID=2184521 RepID=UPI003B5B727D
MKQQLTNYLKHLFFTALGAIALFILFGLLSGKSIKHSRNNLVDKWNNEGPYVFFKNDSVLSVNYIKGDSEKGFEGINKEYNTDSTPSLNCYYPLDSTSFNFGLNLDFKIPGSIYSDSQKILAISDIESNYKTFRDFLINSRVVDERLNWTFGKNHLVLLGDFIDRSYFSTQVLWFIYKLEQDAKSKGGNVHYILGNHEIMNMQGDHRFAKLKYHHIASILGRKQFEFYGKNSFLGRWLESKNTMELINGNLFVHAGISPQIKDMNIELDEMNQLIRANYFTPYYRKLNREKNEDLLIDSQTAPYWYRGYFYSDLSHEKVKHGLDQFGAKTVVVGHTIQSEVNRKYNGKVIGIDVKHPADHYEYFPKIESEGLLIENGNYYRILANGKAIELK